MSTDLKTRYFELKKDGYSHSQITRTMNKEGYRSPKGKILRLLNLRRLAYLDGGKTAQKESVAEVPDREHGRDEKNLFLAKTVMNWDLSDQKKAAIVREIFA